jgi:hypothetical protein
LTKNPKLVRAMMERGGPGQAFLAIKAALNLTSRPQLR